MLTLTRSNPKKKKKKNNNNNNKDLSFLLSQSSGTCPENTSIAATANQAKQVKFGLNPWIVVTRKFGGQQNS